MSMRRVPLACFVLPVNSIDQALMPQVRFKLCLLWPPGAADVETLTLRAVPLLCAPVLGRLILAKVAQLGAPRVEVVRG